MQVEGPEYVQMRVGWHKLSHPLFGKDSVKKVQIELLVVYANQLLEKE